MWVAVSAGGAVLLLLLLALVRYKRKCRCLHGEADMVRMWKEEVDVQLSDIGRNGSSDPPAPTSDDLRTPADSISRSASNLSWASGASSSVLSVGHVADSDVDAPRPPVRASYELARWE